MRTLIFVACLTLTGCGHTWVKPGATQTDFSRDAARCRLMARGMSAGGFAALGSPGYVAGATLGYGIGSAIRQQSNYDDCMMAVGYTPQSSASATEPPNNIDNGKPCSDQIIASGLCAGYPASGGLPQPPRLVQ